ncbi:MAG: HAD-IC family P-type ATPase [Actinobacteria bacterium]|nr:HAD-IC family P-type ATPase [Actinomycetota bacterium]
MTATDVASRVERGLVNDTGEHTSRSFSDIVRANVLTRFNALLGSLFVVILIVGHVQDSLFGIVLVSNALIGIVQEVRAKRTLDQLAVLNAPRARVIRDGNPVEIPVEQVVLDDLLELRAGDQVPADGTIRASEGLELDESLLTGESDPVPKQPGDEALSGSIVVAGAGRMQATRIGAQAYARRLADEARRFTVVRSELVDAINTILKWVTWAIVPTAAVLALSQFKANRGWRDALSGTIAGVVGMVPEGLVLLTSITFAVAAVTLARRRVLVQELPAVEGLARVDTVCLDKTGTLTEGDVQFDAIEPLSDVDPAPALGALGADPNRNATLAAIAAAFPPPEPPWKQTGAIAFSSSRKWSAASFEGHGSWVIGAPEMVLVGVAADDSVRARADELASRGRRVLLLAHSDAPLAGEALPEPLVPVCLVMLEEKIRSDAAETLRYFAEQGVTLKVISGDNPRTVGAVALRVGLPGAGEPFDARELPDDSDELADVMERFSVFGRVTPHQKRTIVAALQARGHVVAMTGDGVNDALALKDADIGVAMGSGAAATRAVAQIVLLDSRFATLPGVVAEGRRVIANVERVANLFITKTVYVMLLALAIGVVRWPFPFLPRHLTVVSSLTIGIPAFFLSLGPNARRYVPGFIRRVLRFAVPAGALAAAATFVAYAIARANSVTLAQAQTVATVVLITYAYWVLLVLARPLNWWRTALVAVMAGAFLVALTTPGLRNFYALHLPGADVVAETLPIAFVAIAALQGTLRVARSAPTPLAAEAGAD